ncbi:MAG: glycoside hydrolase family 2 TIM barrel-domain containing protein, partial [Lentisphaeria bacterium]|nr:glycoside hydrolase family 2 TIM barrel-domain containing protein [Lentisphaeria bacterium]
MIQTFARPLPVAMSLLLGASFALLGQDGGREAIDLAPVWRIQPAQTPEAPPRAEDWGTKSIASGDWRWGAVEAKGTSWEPVLRDGGRGKVHCLWFEQSVSIPANWAGRRNVVDFRRIEGDAIVFVNGQRAGELLRPGGELDLSAMLVPGEENSLRVFLTRDYTGISRDFEHDPLRYTARGPVSHSPLAMERWALGITAPVFLRSFPRPVSVGDVFVQTSWREKAIALEVELVADEAVAGLGLRAVVRDADGQEVLTLEEGGFAAPAGRIVRTLRRSWADPVCWELEAGYLYTVEVSLLRDGRAVDAMPPVRFGFREIWVEGRQVYLNGHVSRWRVDWTSCGLNPVSLSFFRLMGRNLFYTQANPTGWWRDWSETPLLSEALLDAFDEQGMGTFVPAPGISFLRLRLLDDPQAQADYDREMQRWLKLYRNRPSILGWTIGMNSFCPRDGIHPPTMGKRTVYPARSQAQVIEQGIEVVKSHDPTRLVFSHADGNVGDLSTSNSYLNFAPLQEREEWPSEWARAGDMPYFPVEFGQPYTANFWKGKQFLLTEYLAMYFGDRAYREESLDGLRRMVEISLTNKSGHGGSIPVAEFPLYWDFQRLFVRATDRSWRTWGVPGWYYWDFGIGYGNPPKWDGKSIWSRYAAIPEPVTERPDWANENFDLRAENAQPLLVWLAGAPVHTDK